MAIIQHGSLDNFSASIHQEVMKTRPVLQGITCLGDLREVNRAYQPVPIEFAKSPTPRGLALKSLTLTEGFEGFLHKLLNPVNEVYLLSLAWDFSGAPVVQYPGNSAIAQNCLIPLSVKKVREFLGAGVLLFPARFITAGLAVRIQLWESDHGSRQFGKAMTEVANSIKNSEFSHLLSLFSAASTSITGAVNGAAMELIKKASLELMKAIGNILQANSDDYVDFYEGYFPANADWNPGTENYTGHASEIQLTRMI